jgi:hypothetical protein
MKFIYNPTLRHVTVCVIKSKAFLANNGRKTTRVGMDHPDPIRKRVLICFGLRQKIRAFYQINQLVVKFCGLFLSIPFDCWPNFFLDFVDNRSYNGDCSIVLQARTTPHSTPQTVVLQSPTTSLPSPSEKEVS